MTLSIPISSVSDTNRYRKDYGDLSGLKDSLSTLGSIHPITLCKNFDSTYSVIAGGRRFRAAKELGITEFHHAAILQPGKIAYLFEDEVPRHIMLQAELDENLFRLKTKWVEDVLLIADIHAAKRDTEGRKWGTRQTAEVLGPGYGHVKVSFAVRLAKLLRDGDKEILACETMSDAIALLYKRSEENALAVLNKRVLSCATSTSSFLDEINITTTKQSTLKGGDAPSENHLPSSDGALTIQPSGAPIDIPLSRLYRLGDFRDLAKEYPDAFFDHIVCDIPYGIDMNNLDTIVNIEDVTSEHDVKQNVALMDPFVRESFRLVRPGGFCVFSYDLDWHEYLQSTAEQIGWKVQSWPFIACKTSACQNNAAQYNTTKNYECVMFLRRDESSVLRKVQTSSWKSYDFAAERKLYNNPFAKPFALWKDLYYAVSMPGQKVLDPFCGEMSACRAAVNCGLLSYGWEINKKHYDRGIHNMQSVYALLHCSNVTFS